MKAPCSPVGRLLVGLVVVTFFCPALTVKLTAQGVDPGPRPPGTSPFLDQVGSNFESVCQIILGGGGPFKFPPPVCFDIDQPPSNGSPAAAGAGQLIANPGTLAGFWGQGLTVFSTTATVNGSSSAAQSTIAGLGPSFNALSCFGCHAEPAVGGASPGVVTVNNRTVRSTVLFDGVGTMFRTVEQNPEYQASIADNASNTLPCFIVEPGLQGGCAGISLGDFQAPLNFSLGPVVEVRFPTAVTTTTSPDVDPVTTGAVADLFTIDTRSDDPTGCTIGQEPITQQIEGGNAIFRTPTPTFGLGFVENTPELTLTNNLANVNNPTFAQGKKLLNIGGTFNHSGNDQSITRFGWKAQNKSLIMFAGEASNVEMGVTNELFPNERTTGSGSNCTPNEQPEDEVLATNPNATDPSVISSVMENNAVFMRLNAASSQCDFTSTVDGNGAPVCKPLSTVAREGQCFFGSSDPNVSAFCQSLTGLPSYGIGCVLCHSDSLTTANSSQPGLANQPYAPYSDFALHNMGLDGDGIMQGQALGNQFRTAPLWGAGQRFFFMHDGRFTNLDNAVKGHCQLNETTNTNESCMVIQKYRQLSPGNETLILEFVRSL